MTKTMSVRIDEDSFSQPRAAVVLIGNRVNDGIPGVFAPTGSTSWLFDHFGLNVAGICEAALELLQRRGGKSVPC